MPNPYQAVARAWAYLAWRRRYYHELWWGRSRPYRWVLLGLRRAMVIVWIPFQLLRYSGVFISTARPSLAQIAGRHIVMLVISDLRIDPRVERESRFLAAAGYKVSVMFPDITPPFAEKPVDWGPNVHFRPVSWQAAEFMSYFPWLFGDRLLAAALTERPFAYHCHDLTTGLIGYAAARRTGAKLVCDFHEWYSENVSWSTSTKSYVPHPRLKSVVYKMAERLLMRRADAMITVCQSIADELKDMTPDVKNDVHVIRNIPSLETVPTRQYVPLKTQFGIPEDKFVLLWQGGTGPTRLIEPIIESLQYVNDVVFIIRGPSLDIYGEGYRALARATGVEERLILAPPVPSRDVVVAAMGADAGIWTLPALCKNFTYALPNKIFEYLASNLPVLVAHHPEARKLVEGAGVGLSFDPYDPRSIAQALSVMQDPDRRRAMVERIPITLRDLNGEREWNKLVTIYNRLHADSVASSLARPSLAS